MTTEQKFNCIFCKDVFDSKEELQVHFRKHADPKFKSKNRFHNDPLVSDEKTKEKSEMVSCDVCSQMFPTISKAITHKHKVHPDHDAKYFCPWCGKLFTMKHPYNIHIQTTHEKQEQIEDKIFHCDCCDVDFLLPSAMIYHNKFFHRQDTDIPDVGISKKLKLYNQEIIQLHYCAFCGEEYENKVNLFKHITDDHSDENQSPEEVLKCPLCEAIFYHLDAYEIHLSFHTTEDLYSAQNELFAELLDFSLETVPPMVEKVECREDLEEEVEAQSQDTDAEANINSMGIEKFLELAMDDSNSGRVKKKKHKKSKKAAITLDEFLNMNKDVFGEGLDFQGVEEVPTRVVAQQLKNKKSITNSVTSAELEKLKQKGIVVMKVKPAKTIHKKQLNVPTPNRELKTSSEVLTKLINQSNNQIKIVKTTIPSMSKNETETTTTNKTEKCEPGPNNNEIQSKEETKEDPEKSNVEINNFRTKLDEKQNDDSIKDLPSSVDASLPAPSSTNLSDIVDKKPEMVQDEKLSDDDIPEKNTCTSNINTDLEQTAQPTNNSRLGEKSDAETTDDHLVDKHSDEESDSEMGDKNVANADNMEDTRQQIDKVEQPKISPVVNSLSTLKHLSHLTIKPVNQNKSLSPQVTNSISESKLDEIPLTTKKEEATQPVVTTDSESSTKAKQNVDKDPTLDALKNLSKNITIKSLPPTKKNIDKTESDNDDESETVLQKTNSNVIKDVTGNTNLTVKKIKVENTEPIPGNKVAKALNNAVKNTPPLKIINKSNTPAVALKSNNTNLDTPIKAPMKSNILKHLPNITTKPVISSKNALPKVVKQINTPSVETTRKVEEIIEISDIDDSDDDIGSDNKQLDSKQETTKAINPLQNLSKHVTVKSLNQPVQDVQTNIKVEKFEEQDDNDDDSHAHNSDDEMIPNTKSCSQKLSSKSMAFKNALRNLGKNITVKSRTSSPSQSVKSHDNSSQDSNIGKDESASDSDNETGKVKITEMDNDCNDENVDNCEEPDDNEPLVESPHDSCSDNDEFDNFDFESEIKTNTVQKTSQEVTTDKNTICLNNLKNISKNLTIKSLNSNSPDKVDRPKSTQNDNAEVSKNQTKQLVMKSSNQLVKEAPIKNNPTVKNFQKLGKVVDNSANESLNQKVSVNKEVTVKTFQTKTVIQEITTTVTKTIKTVNQTVKQEVRNSSQSTIPILPQKVQGMRPSTSKNLQGVVIRHAAPVPNKVSQVRPVGTVVRPSKQIVPARPGINVMRPPRMPSLKTNLPKSSPNKQPIGKPLKFSPSAMVATMVKRPNAEEVSGPFSCFKKPKESLIPVSDVPSFGGDSTAVQVNSASHISTSNYMSTSKIVKGNSMMTAMQTKSEVTSMQQLNRIGNSVGVKVKNAQFKQTQVQEKSESSSMKRTTLEAIEKLQKQGLLVKKPRLEVNDNSDSEHPENNVGYSSTEEHEE